MALRTGGQTYLNLYEKAGPEVDRSHQAQAQPTPTRWPDKPVPQFTDNELATALEQHEGSTDPVTRDIVRSCVSEWEQRRGLPTADA